MAKTLTASDRKSLIRLASTMEKGSPERRAILAGVRQASLRELQIMEWKWSAPYPKVEVKTWEGETHYLDIPKRLLQSLRPLREQLEELRMDEEMAIDREYEGGLSSNLRSVRREIESAEKALYRAENKVVPKALASMGHRADATTDRSRF